MPEPDSERFLAELRRRIAELKALLESGMSLEDAQKQLKWGEPRDAS